MAGKLAGRLKAIEAKALVTAGRPNAHADGGNLYLRVASPGAGKWTLRFMRAGKAREMGLGPFDADGKHGLTLAEARAAAEEARRLLRAGVDPLAHRRAAVEASEAAKAAATTFRDVTERYLAAHGAGWRNAKHRAQWAATLDTYAHPTMGEMAVTDIGTNDVLRVLQAMWTEKTETASRVRGRIEAVLDYATARGWRAGDNPARWRGHLANLLPRRSKVRAVEHHSALAWQDIPAFTAALRQREATAARALEFAILTAARSGEVLGARWSEVDMEGATWTVPASRMKAHREHRVPLSTAALAVLHGMAPLRPKRGDGFLFPGQGTGKPLSSMALLMFLRRFNPHTAEAPARWRDPRTGEPVTPHGFRSTFRDWCEEATSTPHAVSEAALAHTIGDKVEAAYRRGDLFAKRAALMQEWAEYCVKAPAEVVTMRGAHRHAVSAMSGSSF